MVRTAKMEVPSGCCTKDVPASRTNCTIPRLAQMPARARRAMSESRWIAKSATSPSCPIWVDTAQSIGKLPEKLELAHGYLDAFQAFFRYREFRALCPAGG